MKQVIKKLVLAIALLIGGIAYGQNPFITRWVVENGEDLGMEITGKYGFVVEDLNENTVQSGTNNGHLIITGLANGEYILKLTPNDDDGTAMHRFSMNGVGLYSRENLLEVIQWGDINWSSFHDMFRSCTEMTISAMDIPSTASVTSLGFAFSNCTAITDIPNIDEWDVSNVKNMQYTFRNAALFNSDISSWDVSSVERMEHMFSSAKNFNQDISNWDVGEVKNMNNIFWLAQSFNQNLGNWNLQNLEGSISFYHSGMSCYNFSNSLIGWSQSQTIPNTINVECSNIHYSPDVIQVKEMLETQHDWSFVGEVLGGCSIPSYEYTPFITRWNVQEEQDITIYIVGDYDYIIEDLDDNIIQNETNKSGNLLLTGLESGEYILKITPNDNQIAMHRLYMGTSNPSSNNLLEVIQWGNTKWSSFQYMFYGCSNLSFSALDIPNLENVFSMNSAFRSCTNLVMVPNMNNWDMSNVKDLNNMFYKASSFNQPIGNWDVSGVTTVTQMFLDASSFNQDISDWDVSNVTGMFNLFQGASAFNQPIGSWDVSSCTDMRAMFQRATSFNQNLNNWNVGNVKRMRAMFNDAINFNGDISNWNVSSVEDMEYMFYRASSFNQDIGFWNVGSVTNMSRMFSNATSFNQDIGSWNVSNVIEMSFMFASAASFNQNINPWDVNNVANMANMFNSASSFNQDINSWNVSNVTNMSNIFYYASSFDQNLSNWNIESLANNISFQNSGMSCENYSKTILGWS